MAAFLQRHPEFTLADALGNVDYTFGSEGEANRTGGLPLDVSKVRRIWPCQGGEGHFMARLVKAGTPRVLPAEASTLPKNSSGWQQRKLRQKGQGEGRQACQDPGCRSARRENAVPAGKRCRVKSAAAKHRQGRQILPRALQHGTRLPGSISRRWRAALPWCMAEVFCCPCFPQTGLHVLRAGVFVGSVQKGRFVPEHHLFTAFGALCTNREALTLADRG